MLYAHREPVQSRLYLKNSTKHKSLPFSRTDPFSGPEVVVDQGLTIDFADLGYIEINPLFITCNNPFEKNVRPEDFLATVC